VRSISNTVGALDDIGFEISGTMNRLYLIKETSTSAAVREAARETDSVFAGLGQTTSR